MGDHVLDELHALGIPHTIVACDPALADTAAFCAAYGYASDDSANAIVVVGKSEPRTYALCLVLASCRLDVNGAVRRRMGVKKASFASAGETLDLTGMAIGGVTPFGLGGRLPIWVDTGVMAREVVVVGGGTRDRKVVLKPGALRSLPGAAVVDDLARPL